LALGALKGPSQLRVVGLGEASRRHGPPALVRQFLAVKIAQNRQKRGKDCSKPSGKTARYGQGGGPAMVHPSTSADAHGQLAPWVHPVDTAVRRRPACRTPLLTPEPHRSEWILGVREDANACENKA